MADWEKRKSNQARHVEKESEAKVKFTSQLSSLVSSIEMWLEKGKSKLGHLLGILIEVMRSIGEGFLVESMI